MFNSTDDNNGGYAIFGCLIPPLLPSFTGCCSAIKGRAIQLRLSKFWPRTILRATRSMKARRATGQGMSQCRCSQLPAGLWHRRCQSTCLSLRPNNNNDNSSHEKSVDLFTDFCKEIEVNAKPQYVCKNPRRCQPTPGVTSRHCCCSSSTFAGGLATPALQTFWEWAAKNKLAFCRKAVKR